MPELNTKALEAAIEKFGNVEAKVNEIVEANTKTAEQIDDLKNEIANLATRPVQVVETKSDKQLIADADFAQLFKEYGSQSLEVKSQGFEEFVVKALNLTNQDEGKYAIAEILDRDILNRARDEVALIGEVGSRGMTRNTRRSVKTFFASLEDGFENVEGSSWPESKTPQAGEVRSHVFKRHGKYPVTDEAMVGTDINLWADLLEDIQTAENEYLERSILFGDGSDTSSKMSMRGILSSKRCDIKVGGEAWKPTYGDDARSLDHYMAILTGVDGKMGATDKDVVNFLIDLMAKVKPVYRRKGKFFMHDTTLQVLKKVRDANDRPIFADYQDGSIRIFGKPVVLSDFMPEMKKDAKFIIFGDLSQAIHVTNGDVSKTVLDEVSVDGQVILKKSQEYFEMVGKNDAIAIGVSSAEAPAS